VTFVRSALTCSSATSIQSHVLQRVSNADCACPLECTVSERKGAGVCCHCRSVERGACPGPANGLHCPGLAASRLPGPWQQLGADITPNCRAAGSFEKSWSPRSFPQRSFFCASAFCIRRCTSGPILPVRDGFEQSSSLSSARAHALPALYLDDALEIQHVRRPSPMT
jgi:hypothetical protein